MRHTGKHQTTRKSTGEHSADVLAKARSTAAWALGRVRPGVTPSPVPAAVEPRLTNHPTDNVHNLILPTALKEKQNQLQKPSSVSLAIKSIILTNELQDENTFRFRNTSSEQRSQSTFSFRSDSFSSPASQIKPSDTKSERIRTGKHQKQAGKELMLCRDIP